VEQSRYSGHYSPARFWHKLAGHAKSAGRATLEKSLYLFYAAQSPATPAWARRIIYGALGYFIFPVDAIPDFIPFAGYTDDLGVMAAALATVAFYITPEVKARARHKLDQWFGDSPPGANASPTAGTAHS
jgi:uncharacterized membrane protein YkvA (DUF1232 family)